MKFSVSLVRFIAGKTGTVMVVPGVACIGTVLFAASIQGDQFGARYRRIRPLTPGTFPPPHVPRPWFTRTRTTVGLKATSLTA
jgi:hypothetical protein